MLWDYTFGILFAIALLPIFYLVGFIAYKLDKYSFSIMAGTPNLEGIVAAGFCLCSTAFFSLLIGFIFCVPLYTVKSSMELSDGGFIIGVILTMLLNAFALYLILYKISTDGRRRIAPIITAICIGNTLFYILAASSELMH